MVMTKHKRKAPAPAASRFRASWKGQLRFGLVSFNVEAVNAHSSSGGDIHFNQLHAECHSRIKYQKVCPVHGPVDKSEIVSGYEYAKGKYVEMEAEELNELRSDREKSLSIDNFVAPDKIDPLYFDGRVYYLLPASTDSTEPYQVLVQAMEQKGKYAVGHLVFSGKDQVVLVRPIEGVLVMTMLNYAAEVRTVEDLGTVGSERKIPARTLKLAESLIDSWTDKKFDFAAYEDQYRDRLQELIQAKIAGEEVVEPEETEEAPVINLMDALKKSVAQSRGRQSSNDKPKKGPPPKRSSSRRKSSRKKAS